MARTMKNMVVEAKSRCESVSPKTAFNSMQNGDLLIDVRESEELKSTGRIEGAKHIPRGVLESQADPDTGKGDDELTVFQHSDNCVHVLCASGARAALAADTLGTMGYKATIIEGGLGGWKDADLPVTS